MAAASDTDDASGIFWPGYVDAVTNLAINLLFVIAIMSIVVMTAMMQITKTKPSSSASEQPTQQHVDDARDVQKPGPQPNKLSVAGEGQQTTPLEQLKLALDNVQTSLKKQLKDANRQDRPSARAEKAASQVAQQLNQAQQQLAQLQKQLPANAGKPATRQASDKPVEGGTSTDLNQPANVVQATHPTPTNHAGQSQLQDLSAGGVVVVFGQDVIELTDAEVADLIGKLTARAPIKGSRWDLRVISPKGFSEATRIAYYRVNNLRNALLKHGAAPADIDMRVIETDSDAANNARVLVRLMP